MRAKLIMILGVLLLLVGTTSVWAYTSGSLPGGTSIEVDNTDPLDGDVYYIPVGESAIDITDEGTASVGEGVATLDTTLIYVLDASGSTINDSGGTACGEQQTYDAESVANEIIDCEILSAINLNDMAVSLGSVDEVAMIIFAGSAVTADATPAGGDDPIINPSADANTNSTNDVNEALKSIKVAGVVSEESGYELFTDKPTDDIYGTNFGAGIQDALDVAALASNPNVVVAFISDGANNTGSHVNTFDYGNVVFHTFAVGANADCAEDLGIGSLAEIANLSGGTCTKVEDPNDLPDILPELVGAELESLEMKVDGTSVPIDYIDTALPATGPVTVNYSTTLYGLGAGEHEICVTAHGSDAGGSGSVTDCKTITVVQSVNIDIKPTSCPNPLDIGGKGVLPVAILGTEEFDVTQIEPASVMLEGIAPLRWSIDDVATSYGEAFNDPVGCMECTEEGPDGFMDLTLKFDKQAVVEAIGEVEDGQCLLLGFNGSLMEDFGGISIVGQDVVRIIKK